MNSVDKQYLELLGDIIYNGKKKVTRAGAVRSVFGRQMRFNLKEGLPLLTTKKVFYKGIIHELLWFLKGETNIKYLVDNNVHIWDDDAYRYYRGLCAKHKMNEVSKDDFLECVRKEERIFLPCAVTSKALDKVLARPSQCTVGATKFSDDYKTLEACYSNYDGLPAPKVTINVDYYLNKSGDDDGLIYRFGDLGPIYGRQWRRYGKNSVDQIGMIIDTLKTNPDDRRMLCCAWNVDMLDNMALPPCHVLFQFYTTEIGEEERTIMFSGKHKRLPRGEYELDEDGIPRRELSCSFTMRSNDFCCGNPYNIAQYAMLTYMLCEVCNMIPGELVYNGNDVHVYENHVEAAAEQLVRHGSDTLPTLRFARKIDNIDDFTYDDFIVEGYNPDPAIKYQLNVG